MPGAGGLLDRAIASSRIRSKAIKDSAAIASREVGKLKKMPKAPDIDKRIGELGEKAKGFQAKGKDLTRKERKFQKYHKGRLSAGAKKNLMLLGAGAAGGAYLTSPNQQASY